jgi:hypothetical protein
MLNDIFEKTTLDQVAGTMKYKGKSRSLNDLDDAIRIGVMEQWHDCRRCEIDQRIHPVRC